MKVKEEQDAYEDETDGENSREMPLLNDEASYASNTLHPMQHFVTVPSYSSFYNDFYPPDLTKFNRDRGRMENSPVCMTSAWRVIAFFIVVFVLPTLLISIPLYARYHLYHAKTVSLMDGDMRSFHNDVSSFWCQGQRVISNGTFEAYLTKEARRLKKRTRISKLSSELLLTHDEVEEWGVHLIQGSYFTFSACSRWPGGTMLVVQGEENMRRCFYNEDRIEAELGENENENESSRKYLINPEANDATEMGGGEVFADDEELTQHQIIQQIYSNNRNRSNYPLSSGANSAIRDIMPEVPKEVFDSEQEASVSKNEFLKSKKSKETPDEKKRIVKEKSLREIESDRNETDRILYKRTPTKWKKNVHSSSSTVDVTKMESVLVDSGSFFFNINDTLDITTGNSSFSSSEEFLKQCSNTIVSVDLSPFPDCNQRTSISSDSPIRWRFRANDTDYYYFIFTSDNSIEVNIISFKLLLERRLYDVSKRLDKCSNKSECVFPFSFMKSEGVIVDFNERYKNISKLEKLSNYELTTICQPRSVVYTVFILLVPFIIIMFAFR